MGRVGEWLAVRGGTNRVVYVLGKTYNLDVSHPQHLEQVRMLVTGCASFRNEHEIAVMFLARFVRTIQPDHPQARAEVEKYIRNAQGAYARGLVTTKSVLNELFESASARLNIDQESIPAA